ncbi:hypothetical protein CPC08DRAFT_765372 [Agrocybe pediades]|nr:hypothetical protein CPC08DRAFT_765372 [Agrocybe pediades]
MDPPKLAPFRQTRLYRLPLGQYPAIPEAFRLWILEWPEKMAMFGLWPALPMVEHGSKWLEIPFEVNWIAYGSGNPLLCTLVYDKGSANITENLTPALLLWRTDHHSWWLLFDEEKPELFGRVLCIDAPDSRPSIRR